MPPPRLVGAAGRKKKKARGQAPTSGEGVDANADAPIANEAPATASEREGETDESTTESVDHRPPRVSKHKWNRMTRRQQNEAVAEWKQRDPVAYAIRDAQLLKRVEACD